VLLDGGDNAGTIFRGHCPLKIWECKKRAKFSTFYNNFRVWPQISLNWIGISTSGKRRYQTQLIPCWMEKKLGELWSTNTRDYAANVYPPKSNFLEGHILAPRVCCAPEFLQALENNQVLLAHPSSGTVASFTFFFKNWWKIGSKCSVLAARTLEPGGVALLNFATWRAVRWGWQRGCNFWGSPPP